MEFGPQAFHITCCLKKKKKLSYFSKVVTESIMRMETELRVDKNIWSLSLAYKKFFAFTVSNSALSKSFAKQKTDYGGSREKP